MFKFLRKKKITEEKKCKAFIEKMVEDSEAFKMMDHVLKNMDDLNEETNRDLEKHRQFAEQHGIGKKELKKHITIYSEGCETISRGCSRLKMLAEARAEMEFVLNSKFGVFIM